MKNEITLPLLSFLAQKDLDQLSLNCLKVPV